MPPHGRQDKLVVGILSLKDIREKLKHAFNGGKGLVQFLLDVAGQVLAGVLVALIVRHFDE